MKILAIAEFDAAGVLTGHREALRALGVDYRIAVIDEYGYRSDLAHDWPHADGSIGGLREFAEEADILQFHPAIGQPWSSTDTSPHFHDGENEGLFGIDWTVIPARRVSLFHGSRNAWANAPTYAAHWKKRGHAIWATTLDYVIAMGADYAPPAIFLPPGARAPLRGNDDPLIVAHSPTDPSLCHTEEFRAIARTMDGIVIDYMNRRPHAEVMRRKRQAHAGFDHLRGAFSVNTLENCALGLVPLVGVRADVILRLHREGFGGANLGFQGSVLFQVRDVATLQRMLRKHVEEPAYTRSIQDCAYTWFEDCWRPEIIGARLKRMYEGL
jgi:hypothetical protein